MNSNQQRLLIILALLVGCNSPSAAPPVASLSDASSTPVEAAPVRQPAKQQTPAQPPKAKQGPLRYTVRKAETPPAGPTIPPVLLSEGHAKLCNVQVGDSLPAISLPKIGGGQTELASLRGSKATVVLFWNPDRWMARTALIDMQRDVASQFPADQVAVVGIAVRQPQGAVQAALNEAKASFPQLIDSEGKAFTAVGNHALPRIYVLDPAGKIVWFDIEYSEGTRRELWQTLQAMTK